LGWSKLASLTLWEWTMGLAMVTAWTALGLFIHKLVATSTERARLIQELEAARNNSNSLTKRTTNWRPAGAVSGSRGIYMTAWATAWSP